MLTSISSKFPILLVKEQGAKTSQNILRIPAKLYRHDPEQNSYPYLTPIL